MPETSRRKKRLKTKIKTNSKIKPTRGIEIDSQSYKRGWIALLEFVKSRFFLEIVAILLFFFGLFIIYSMISPTASGSIGAAIGGFCNARLGWFAYSIPFILILISAVIFMPTPMTQVSLYAFAIVVILFSLETLRALFFPDLAGAMGVTTAKFCSGKVGVIASVILYILAIIITSTLFAGISISDLAAKIFNILAFKQSDSEEPEREKDEQGKHELSESLEDFEPIELMEDLADKSEEFEEPKSSDIPIAASPSPVGVEELPNLSNSTIFSDYMDNKETPPEHAMHPEEPDAGIVMFSNEIQYTMPPISFLSLPDPMKNRKPVKDYSQVLMDTLSSFGVSAKIINIVRGPSVTRYELQPGKGVKVSKFTQLTNDISLVFAAPIRIEAPVPGKSCIGVEVPNDTIEPVFLREIFASDEFNKKNYTIPIALGKDITGKAIVADMVKMPHLLVAGSTGSGKSVCMNCLIASILYKAKPTEVQMVMVDPKRVELSMYEGIPHLIDIKATPDKKIITDPKIATLVLQQMTEIMDKRYDEFSHVKARNIGEYNSKQPVKLPYLLIFIDELADLMMVSGGGVDKYIARLAQMGRAAGMHLIIATQRPSVDVLTGIIKVNIPSRIAFAVASQVDSRTILDRSGAEKLLGKGDMLYLPGDAPDTQRIQGAFVSSEDLEKVVDFWLEQPPPENMQAIDIQPPDSGDGGEQEQDDDEDALYSDALRIILNERSASASILQRKLKIGYARAGRIIDQMERKGVVGPANGSKCRKILVGAMAGDHFLKNEV